MNLPKPDDIKSIENAIYIEHHVQRIITQQETNGVYFNKERARFYIYVLREKQQELYKQIRPLLSLEIRKPFTVPISKPYLKDGSYSSSVVKWYGGKEDDEVPDICGQFSRVEFCEPDLGSRQKLITQLLALRWTPRSFTPKGSPKLTVDGEPCPSLLKINSKVGKWVAEWYTYRHRESQIKGWLKNLRSDNRLSAKAITIGTPTFRFRHSVVVNVPKAAKQILFGHQMRSLFCVPRGHRLVGHDASGLELRMLAHYINDSVYTNEVVHGDPHTRNQRDAGLATRDDAKTFIYAFIYGAGDGKIGSIVGGNARSGKLVKAKFLSANPKLKELIETTQRAAKRGYLIGLDGRKISLRRDKLTGKLQIHKALNTLLQAAGATVMKWSMVVLDEWVRQYRLDAKKVVDMHDEGQAEVINKDVDMYKTLAELSLKQAGVLLQLNCPLAAEAKDGNNWAQTH